MLASGKHVHVLAAQETEDQRSDGLQRADEALLESVDEV